MFAIVETRSSRHRADSPPAVVAGRVARAGSLITASAALTRQRPDRCLGGFIAAGRPPLWHDDISKVNDSVVFGGECWHARYCRSETP
ncbi:hypothetical protein EVAR_53955_1 [Eumeta japonica]|uniref:Uncharacterized protein n=1 Tax=Eumeta variegata TaxID=151549 RepID=A0A4C1XY63_EUMVA|nr:hypothetical protein EVAR_53955_1 [Eumeta japonica]